jgi:cyclopropane fatty-acyl-phospholipid synthase-like methyltransferase
MKNIINEKPSLELAGIALTHWRLMDDADIKNKEILDIGCGLGWFELNAVNKGADRIVGIEISKQDLFTAKRHVVDSKVSFKVGSAIDLPFEDHCFDTVVAWEVLEHIPKGTEVKMFREVNRVLKPGGAFYLSTPETSFLSNVLDPAWWLIGHRHYTKETLCDYVVQGGFTLSTIMSHGKHWDLISNLNMYIAKWIFRRRSFYEAYINKKVEKEHQESDGFVDIYLKCNKIK